MSAEEQPVPPVPPVPVSRGLAGVGERAGVRAGVAGAGPARGRGPWPGARADLMVVAFALVYAAAVFLGRMSRLPGTSLSLVWPAAAVGFVWLLWASHRGRRELAGNALLLALIAGAINVATGAAVHVGLALGGANVVQALVELGALRRLRPSAWRLRRPADLAAWVLACLAGAAAGGLIGPFVLAGPNTGFWALAGAWTLRNAVNTFVFGALALRVAGAGLRSLWPPRARLAELTGAFATLGAAYGVVFGLADGLPLAYLVLPLSMWIALRFPTTMAAAHVLWAAFLVVVLTMAGRGPFAATSPTTRVLLAQAFVAIVGLVALALALHRDERDRLLHDLGRARERADAQAAELAQISQAKTDFLATMSHEIRTPLNGVLGFTALLAQSPGDPAAGEWARAADTAGRALLGIVNDGLDLAKIEAGGVQLETIGFDVVAVAQEALLPCRPTGGPTGGRPPELRLVVGDDLHRDRVGDPGRLRQVLTNLVANAVKFTAEGSVTLSLEGAGDLVRFQVIDTGIGMTAEQQEHMLEPFRQASADTSRLYGGTGLGLTIAAGLVAAMGGGLTVSSEPGVGSTFTVDLELPRGAGPAARPAAAAGEQARLAGVRVLVAEDNLMNQLVARATLQGRGLVVDVVGDGAEAVTAVLTGDYEAVFMDCRMPVVDGLEATRRIRAAGATLPVIAMTAGAFDEDRRACAEAGMTDFLPKPWKPEELADVLTRLALVHLPAATAGRSRG